MNITWNKSIIDVGAHENKEFTSELARVEQLQSWPELRNER